MKKRLRVKWGNVAMLIAGILITTYMVVSIVGMFVSEPVTKPNGNVCRGYDYHLKICSGDINAE